MALAGSDFGQVYSYKFRKNRTSGDWEVTVFDKAGTGPDEQTFADATLEGAFDAAQAYVESLVALPLEWCFAGSIIYIEN